MDYTVEITTKIYMLLHTKPDNMQFEIKQQVCSYLKQVMLPQSKISQYENKVYVDCNGDIIFFHFTLPDSLFQGFNLLLSASEIRIEHISNILSDISVSVRRDFLESLSVSTRIPNSRPEYKGIKNRTLGDGLITNPKCEALLSFVTQSKSQAVYVKGKSSSGKSILVAQVLAKLYQSVEFTWLNLTNVGINEYELFYSIANDYSLDSAKHIIVLDDIQSNPSLIDATNKIISTFSNLYANTEFITILIGWDSVESYVKSVYPDINVFSCNGGELVSIMVNKSDVQRLSDPICQNSNGDAFLAHQTIKFFQEKGDGANVAKLNEFIYNNYIKQQTISSDAKRVLYHLAALGEFEIHASMQYLFGISQDGSKELIEHRLIREYSSSSGEQYFYIGHRSLAHVLYLYLHNLLPTQKQSMEIAMEYLKNEGTEQIYSMLERLDLVLTMGSHMLGNIWKAFTNARGALFLQVEKDNTWGNNIASMIFCANALQAISFDKQANLLWGFVADAIRKLWRPAEDNNSIEYIGVQTKYPYGITSEICDFEQIKNRMIEEDEKIDFDKSMKGDEIDYRRFHNNWVLGLLLDFEGKADDGRDGIRNAYIECAKKMQLPCGGFYPQRVSWVTARIIMGLCECGLNYQNSQVVRRACDWLVEQFEEQHNLIWKQSFMTCGGWVSGTGTWNTNEQATLMCLSALLMANYPILAGDCLQSVIDTVWNNRHRLNTSTNEDDAEKEDDKTWLIDTMILAGKDIFSMRSEIQTLLNHINNSWSQVGKTANETHGESCQVSFDTFELMNLIWTVLSKNINILLGGLQIHDASYGVAKQIFISYRRIEGGGGMFAQRIYNGLQPRYSNDVFLDVVDLRRTCDEWLRELEIAVHNCKIFILIATDDAFKRCASENYKVENDVFVQEIKTALSLKNIKIITVFNGSNACLDELEASNPSVFEIIKPIKPRQAVFFDSSRADSESALLEDIYNTIDAII